MSVLNGEQIVGSVWEVMVEEMQVCCDREVVTEECLAYFT